MRQGVRPPLTARTNLPRNSTASRAWAAMNVAALRATSLGSAKTSISIGFFFRSSPGGGFLYVPAELETHGGQQPVLEVRLAARCKSFVKRCAEYRHRYGLIDRSLDRPPSFARVRHPAREFAQRRIFDQCRCGQVEQP